MNTSLSSESEFITIDDDDDEIIVCSDDEFDLFNDNDIGDTSFISATEDISEPSEDSSRISEEVQVIYDNISQQNNRNQESSINEENNLTFILPLPGFENLRPSPTLGEHFSFDAMHIATQLLEAAARQLEPHLVVDESTVRSIAHGLSLAIGNTSSDGTVGEGRLGEGRLVASILINSQTGVIMAYAVAQLVPYAIVDVATGVVLGTMLHHVTRGFAVDERSRSLVTNATGRPLLNANMIPAE